MENYRFRTSLGYVYLSFDHETLETVTWPDRDRYGKETGKTLTAIQSRQFKITEGKKYICKLYDGSVENIEKMLDDSLWATIELSDGAYGSPEYLLEKI